MFRYERPQAGRQRQFHQLGIELLGTDDARADVEVITIAVEILGKLGFKSLKLNLNTVGSKSDRARYREALVSYLTPYKEDLDQDSQDRLDRNPLRILDSKDQTTQAIVANAPTIVDYLEDNSRQHFDRVQELLSLLGIDYVLNPCLVRGLDYYTHTAFEIISSDLGAQGTVCGGGRYDGLLEQLGGKNIPAVGWAMGLERLIILLQQLQQLKATSPDCYMIAKGNDAEQQSFVLAHQLRRAGLKVEINFGGGNFGKQFKKADRLGAKLCLVIGEEEAQQQTVGMKWMATQESTTIPQSQLLADVEHIKTKVKG
jgi:histidyl-tRNA synthetase